MVLRLCVYVCITNLHLAHHYSTPGKWFYNTFMYCIVGNLHMLQMFAFFMGCQVSTVKIKAMKINGYWVEECVTSSHVKRTAYALCDTFSHHLRTRSQLTVELAQQRHSLQVQAWYTSVKFNQAGQPLHKRETVWYHHIIHVHDLCSCLCNLVYGVTSSVT